MKKVFYGILYLPLTIAALEYEGLLFPAQHIVLSTKSNGVVVALPHKEGEYVAKGTILLIQDPTEDSLKLILADQACSTSSIQKSGTKEHDPHYTLKEISYHNHFIRAPFDGTIVKISAKKHEYYTAGTKAVELADLSKLITEINVTPAKFEKMKNTETVFTIYKGNQKTTGRFYAYNPLAEPGIELILIKIIMNNPHKWFAGTYVNVQF